MPVHIGEIIKMRVKAKGLTVTEFAKRINYTRRNVYVIYKSETIDTGVLLKISEVLGENLFQYFVPDNTLPELKKISDALSKHVSGLDPEVRQ